MSGELKYTERDLVLAKREGWRAARAALVIGPIRGEYEVTWEAGAAQQYPLPKIVRPRVAVDAETVRWRVLDGVVQWTYTEYWSDLSEAFGERMYLTAERITILADLLANSTELIDDDGPAPQLLGRDANG